jgi:hypothetical protein
MCLDGAQLLFEKKRDAQNQKRAEDKSQRRQ